MLRRTKRQQQGLTYWLVLFMVAATALISLRALEGSQIRAKRDREAELLFVGAAYQEAIRAYYENSPGMVKEFPPELASLLLDSRATTTRRPLRRLYPDPVTGSANWGLVMAPDGRVQGVYSLSTAVPLRRAGFPPEAAGFARARTYQDWKFIHQPR